MDNKQTFSKATVSLIAAVSLLLVMSLLVVSSYSSAKRYGADTEAAIKSLDKESQNIHSRFTQSVMETAQVATAYQNDLSKLIKDALNSNKPDDGAAVIQFLRERYPELNADVYKTVQQTIISGRMDFASVQTRKLDVIRQYEASLEYVWRGFWLEVAGYPKIDLKDYDIVLSTDTKNTFKDREEKAPIKVFQ